MRYVPVDSVDYKILNMLRQNARTPLRELARAVGLSPSGVRKRVERLTREGVIRGYTVVLDHRRLGGGLTAFVSVRADPREIRALASAVAGHRGTAEVYRITGERPLLIKARVKDTEELSRFMNRLTEMGAGDVVAHVVVEHIKGEVP